jgi:hypothetical protein
MPAAIIERAATWGISCHKLERELDSGAILKTVEFPLSPAEDHDSLDLKIQLAAKRLTADVAGHFVEFWDAAITPRISHSGCSRAAPGSCRQRTTSRSRTTQTASGHISI